MSMLPNKGKLQPQRVERQAESPGVRRLKLVLISLRILSWLMLVTV